MPDDPAETAKTRAADRISGTARRDAPETETESSETQKSVSSDDEPDINVKDDWNGRYTYTPDSVHNEIDNVFDLLKVRCRQELGWQPRKNMHYYPVQAIHGVNAVGEMSPTEFIEAIRAIDEDIPFVPEIE